MLTILRHWRQWRRHRRLHYVDLPWCGFCDTDSAGRFCDTHRVYGCRAHHARRNDYL